MRETSELVSLLQILHHCDPDHMEKMIQDALEQWEINDFHNSFNDIDIGKYLAGHIDRTRKLRSYALKGIESARRAQNT